MSVEGGQNGVKSSKEGFIYSKGKQNIENKKQISLYNPLQSAEGVKRIGKKKPSFPHVSNIPF
jgi:hypothetical protein